MKKALIAGPFVFVVPVALLFALGSRRKTPQEAIDEMGPTKLPGTVDPMREPRLFIKPTEGVEVEIDEVFDRWIRDPRSGSMLSDSDLRPRRGQRELTAFERWALSPYFHESDLSGPKLHMGEVPPEITVEIPKAIHAATMADGSVWFPHGAENMTDRWWLAVLAHELYHSGQVRLGSTQEEANEAWRHWGYADSPLEVSARWKQREVYDGLGERAQMFFESV